MWWYGLLGLVTLWWVAVAVTLAIRSDFFALGRDLDESGPDAAIWAFLGAGLAAGATLAAALIADSYNRRTHALAVRAEHRARDEAAAGFLALLTYEADSGRRPTSAQYVGVVVCLRALDHQRAAAGILEVAIEQQELTSAATARLIDEFLEPDARPAWHRRACRLLRNAAPRLVSTDAAGGGTFAWPERLTHWPHDFERDAKIDIIVAVGELLVAAESRDFWVGRLDWAALLLYDAVCSTHDDEGVRDSAFVVLDVVLQAVEGVTLNRGSERVDVAEIDAALRRHDLHYRWDVAARQVQRRLSAQWGLKRRWGAEGSRVT